MPLVLPYMSGRLHSRGNQIEGGNLHKMGEIQTQTHAVNPIRTTLFLTVSKFNMYFGYLPYFVSRDDTDTG